MAALRWKNTGGFSLVELLATLVILALLLALAVPAYHAHLVHARRVQGQATLLKLMQQQERYYSQNNTYIVFSAASQDAQGGQFQWWSGEDAREGAVRSAYEIDAIACPGLALTQCVQLRARPGTARVDQQFRDADCGVLTLRSTGERGSSGPAARCWL